MLGYFLSPAMSGWLMSIFSQTLPACKGVKAGHCSAAFASGFRVVLGAGGVALVFMVVAWVHGECTVSRNARDAQREGGGGAHHVPLGDIAEDGSGGEVEQGGVVVRRAVEGETARV